MIDITNIHESSFACYSVLDVIAGELLTIEAVPLRRLFSQPAFKNPLVNLRIHATGSRVAMEAMRDSLLASLATVPPLNSVTVAQSASGKPRAVQCITHPDNPVYASQREACAAYGIDASAMSKHMRCVPGYSSIKGLQFKYIA